MDAIDLLLKACEKVVQLVQYRSAREKRFFDEVIEPLFRSAEAAAGDYYAFLDSCNRELQGSGIADSTVRKLADERARMKLARTSVCATAGALRASGEGGPLLTVFADAIEGMFYSGYVPVHGVPTELAVRSGVRRYDSRDPELLARVQAPGSPRMTNFPPEPSEVRALRGSDDLPEIHYHARSSVAAHLVDLFQLASVGHTTPSVLRVQIEEAKAALEYFWSQASAAHARLQLRMACANRASAA